MQNLPWARGELLSASQPHVGILTRHDDFHAYVFRHALQERGVSCSIFGSDSLATEGGIAWSPSGEVTPTIRDLDGQAVAVDELDLLWWRRLTGEPRIPEAVTDEAARDLVVNDCRAAMLGLFLTDFAGVWISHPEATRLAANKLLQLRTAIKAGLRVPRTLVSQDPGKIRRFCEDLGYEVVVKPVAGTPKTPVMTGRVTEDLLADEQAVTMSPAIYQELVPGTRHLRVCCFGPDVHTALIETELLDWRYPLDAEITPYELDGAVAGPVRQVVADLGLRMGIIDMKLGADGHPVWLEVNPQGQFLFLEGTCGMPLIDAFSGFLETEARRAPVPG